MKAFLRLFAFELRTGSLIANMAFQRVHSPKEYKRSITLIIILGVCLLPAYVGYVGLSGVLVSAFSQMDALTSLFTLVLTAFCALSAFLGIFTLLSKLFLARDSEFFAALPVLPQTVFAAKLARIYVTQLILSALFLLPIVATAAVTSGEALRIIPLGLLAIVIVPVFPLLLSSIVAMLITPLAARIRNREGFIMGITMVFSIAIMILQITVTRNLPDDIDPAAIITMLRENGAIIDVLAGIFPPTAWMGRAIGGDAVLLNILLVFLSAGAGMALLLLLAGKMYYRGALAHLEAPRGKTKKAHYVGQTGRVMSIFKKEWLCILKTPVYAMNSLCGIIMFPLMLIIYTMGGSGDQFSRLTDMVREADPILLGLILGGIFSFMACTNTGGSTMVTREGKSFYINKIIPVPAADIVRGKLLAAFSISAAFIAISFLGTAIFLGRPDSAAIGAVLALALGLADCEICVFFDCYHPNLRWANQTVAIKQSLNAVMCLLVSLILLMVCAVLALTLSMVSLYLSAGAVLVFLLALDIIMYRLCTKKGAQLLERVEP